MQFASNRFGGFQSRRGDLVRKIVGEILRWLRQIDRRRGLFSSRATHCIP